MYDPGLRDLRLRRAPAIPLRNDGPKPGTSSSSPTGSFSTKTDAASSRRHSPTPTIRATILLSLPRNLGAEKPANNEEGGHRARPARSPVPAVGPGESTLSVQTGPNRPVRVAAKKVSDLGRGGGWGHWGPSR